MANKTYKDFASGEYDPDKIILQADATTGQLSKLLNKNFNVIKTASLELTNTQILALPSTQYDIIPAPGTDLWINCPATVQLGFAILMIDWHGDYSNINSNAELRFRLSSGGPFTRYGNTNDLVNFFAWGIGGTDNPIWNIGAQDFTAKGGNYNSRSDFNNKPVQFSVNNQGNGDFTGGHANNKLTVKLFYTLEQFPY